MGHIDKDANVDNGSSATARQRQVKCPTCGTLLSVPVGFPGGLARCGQCRERFHIPPHQPAIEEAIIEWLDDDSDDDSAPPKPQQPLAAALEDAPQEAATQPPATGGEIRLVKFDRTSALFEFPARRLREDHFRCCMPRRCLQCSTRHHLEAHVIIFAGQLITSVSLEAERSAGEMVLHNKDVEHVSTLDLLSRLPKVPNVPAPADLPMPYWLCDMCSNSGIIAGQIQANTGTGDGWCRLLIGNLRRAEEFMISAGGSDSPPYEKLHKYLEQTAESRWELVPLTVQNRVLQWFTPDSKEGFIGYVPDRDRQRTEDGMAGLVVSTHRLIHHTSRRHHEVQRGQPLEFQLAMSGDKGNLRIKTADWMIKHFTIDRQGLARLRRSLTLSRFHVHWG